MWALQLSYCQRHFSWPLTTGQLIQGAVQMCFFVSGLLHLPFPHSCSHLYFSQCIICIVWIASIILISWPLLQNFIIILVLSPLVFFLLTIQMHTFNSTLLFSHHPLFLPARVFIFAQPTAECLTRWKELGVKRQHCCQLRSLSPSLSLSFSLLLSFSDSRYVSANVLLTYSAAMKYQQNSYPHS